MSLHSLDLPSRPAHLCPDDAAWPAGLLQLSNPPAGLRIAGVLAPLGRAVAVVGTRHADDDGLDFARRLGFELTEAGCVVVSGGARGINRAAHEGALEAGGPTVAVLATGFGRPYPPGHGPLFERIARAGALVSEHPDDTPPRAGRFLERNRLVAAMTRLVVVVQAPVRSGALSTAAWARRLGRPVFAVPASPWDPRGAGCLALLRQGGAICTRARDVLSVAALGLGEPPRRGSCLTENSSRSVDLDADGKAVMSSLGPRGRHVDEIARTVGLPVARVQHALLELRLLGLIKEQGSGRYARARPFPPRGSVP